MSEIISYIFFIVILFLIARWFYKIYIKIPQEDKEIGIYKYKEFKTVIENLEIHSSLQTANENCLAYKVKITNGVQTIGHIEYSINDYIPTPILIEKQHNYYFKVEGKVGSLVLSFKSTGYIKDFNQTICETEITKLKNQLLNNSDYKTAIKLHQLR